MNTNDAMINTAQFMFNLYYQLHVIERLMESSSEVDTHKESDISRTVLITNILDRKTQILPQHDYNQGRPNTRRNVNRLTKPTKAECTIVGQATAANHQKLSP